MGPTSLGSSFIRSVFLEKTESSAPAAIPPRRDRDTARPRRPAVESPDVALPKAKFSVLLPAGGVVPGTRAEGTLQMEVPEAIPRADHIHLFLRTQAVASYGREQYRSIYRRDLFVCPLEVKLDRERPTPPARGPSCAGLLPTTPLRFDTLCAMSSVRR